MFVALTSVFVPPIEQLFYYRPAMATHFATADAGYLPNSRTVSLPCTRIDATVNLTAQKSFFLREESNLEQRSEDGRLVVIPNVWDLSVDMWFLHPSVTHSVHEPGKTITDCLHFCVFGNAYHGVYEAVNRWFWWDMLNKLKERNQSAWNPTLDHTGRAAAAAQQVGR